MGGGAVAPLGGAVAPLGGVVAPGGIEMETREGGGFLAVCWTPGCDVLASDGGGFPTPGGGWAPDGGFPAPGGSWAPGGSFPASGGGWAPGGGFPASGGRWAPGGGFPAPGGMLPESDPTRGGGGRPRRLPEVAGNPFVWAACRGDPALGQLASVGAK